MEDNYSRLDTGSNLLSSHRLTTKATPVALFTALTFVLFPALTFGQAGTGTGLKGDYFSNTNLTGQVAASRIDPQINFAWGAVAAAAGVPADKFSARWTGQVEAPVTGTFTFGTRSDDGIRLWVNNRLLIDNWTNHSPMWDQTIPVTLNAGQRYNIQIEYYDNTGGANLQLYWWYPGQGEQIIPKARLYPVSIALQPTPTTVSRVWVGDLPWISATNGWGPVERNRSNGETGARDGRSMKIAGHTYSRGLGVHARSEILFALDDRFDRFKGTVGIDDEVGNNGSAVFEIWLDGRRAFQSPTMRGNMPALAFDIAVENARDMRLVVLDAGDGIGSDHADWGNIRFEGVERVTFLSDMKWESSTNGLGPVERDRPVGGASSRDASRLELRGQYYRKGLGTMAVSEVVVDLDKKFERFSSVVGIDDDANGAGSVVFEVWGDNTKLWDSGMVRGRDPVKHVSVMVSGRETLKLRVLNGGDGSAMDMADWADAKLLPMGSDAAPPPAPSNLTATAGNQQVQLAWSAVAGATSYSVFRATTSNGQGTSSIATVNGTNFTNGGLTNGTRYFYKVKANNGGGTSPFSMEASATPNGTPPPPPPPPLPAPTNLTATAGNAQVMLNWQAVAGATSYNISRSNTANGTVSFTQNGVTGTTFNNTGLTNGQQYFYKVRAVNAGGAGAPSNEASATPMAAPPPPVPTNLTATAGDKQVTLNWTPSAGATSYAIFRNTSATIPGAALQTVVAPPFLNTGLTNGTAYFYWVRAIGPTGTSAASGQATATPQVPAPTTAPTLTLTVGNGQLSLSWTAVTGATGYRVYRGTATNAQAPASVASPTGTTFNNTGLTNGTTYFYKVTAVNGGGESPRSNEVSGTPTAPPTVPTGLTATAGNATITLNWAAVTGATSYRVYRGTAANAQAATPVATDLTAPSFVNSGLTNGTAYFFKVTAVNAGGESGRSAEVSSTPVAPPPPTDLQTLQAHRFLRQATWGPKPGDAERVKQIGKDAFLTEQFNAPSSVFPDSLLADNVEMTQERFFQNALVGQDQLRQRVAWTLHKMWVISAVQIDCAEAIVPYYRLLMRDAFGNYRDLMRDITLNPGMGDYLTMRGNKAQSVTGVPPNENYARELLQLFTTGIPRLNQNGTPAAGAAYTEDDVKDLARAFTGWTYGDGDPNTIPTGDAREDYTVPMEPVARFHDTGIKTFLGSTLPANQTARKDLDDALDIVFNHPNLGPFVARHFIQTMVTSNPSPQFISDVAAAFNNNGSGVRGDLRAVVRTMLLHPEANLGTNPQGKLMEPALFISSMFRSLNATVADHPVLTDYSEEMGQKVLYPPSVFSYFSPGFRVRGLGGLMGPEYQILTSVTSLSRTNFIGRVLNGSFGTDVTIDYTEFRNRAANAADLVDYANTLFLGGQLSPEMRTEIINAVQVTPATNVTERVRTALYLILASAQYQVDR